MEDNFMELMDLIRTNRTYRRFKQTAVSDEIIAEVLEAARNAASAANRQPLSYVVVKSQKKRSLHSPSGRAIFHLSRDSQKRVRSLYCSSELWKIRTLTRIVTRMQDLPSRT